MIAPTLFDLPDSRQAGELARVSGVISDRILAFAAARIVSGQTEFFANELREFVSQASPVAPASADRILRALRREGRVRYTVINRSKSLYRLF